MVRVRMKKPFVWASAFALVAAIALAQGGPPPTRPPAPPADAGSQTFEAAIVTIKVPKLATGKCEVSPKTVYIDRGSVAKSANRRLQVLWVLDSDDDSTAVAIAPKGTQPEIWKFPGAAKRFEIPAGENSVNSGLPNKPTGQGNVRWEYVATATRGTTTWACDPQVCVRDGSGGGSC